MVENFLPQKFLAIRYNNRHWHALAHCDYSCMQKVFQLTGTMNYHTSFRLHAIIDYDITIVLISKTAYYTRQDNITVPSRKRAHGRCPLHAAKIGGWADIRGISSAFIREERPGKLPTLSL